MQSSLSTKTKISYAVGDLGLALTPGITDDYDGYTALTRHKRYEKGLPLATRNAGTICNPYGKIALLDLHLVTQKEFPYALSR